MSGHVFIIHGDLTKLACDTWLMPCGRYFAPRSWWRLRVPDWKPPGTQLDSDQPRVSDAGDWPRDLPKPWLVHQGGRRDGSTPIAWYVEGVRQFLRIAAPAAANDRFVKKRAKPLIGIPVVGTGRGGAGHKAGDIVKELLPELYQAVESYDCDIALVTFNRVAYTAAIRARADYNLDHSVWPNELDERLREDANRLAEEAKAGKLVLFLGAGVSAGANLPMWNDLLTQLARESGVSAELLKEGGAFSQMNALDRARILDQRLEKCGMAIGAEVVAALKKHKCHALAHSLLAALPVAEVVTTNYDSLFEQASESVDIPVAVLPYHSTAEHKRWLLKMHGCVERPKDIVLTRSDYIRYDARRAALRGIVQAMLITRQSKEEKATDAWKLVEKLLKELGG
jgi:hypothetical protein